MQWIHDYDLFLFDFDGLLVNTEELHFEAYKMMCAGRGFSLSWSLSEYLLIAHLSSEGLRNSIYQSFPALFEKEPHWDVLYKEKTSAYLQLLEEGKVELMPGVDLFIREIAKRGKKMAVVTNSQLKMIEKIQKLHPVLQEIPLWITREDYKSPKPAPDCYIEALKRLQIEGTNAVGFEDSPRGLLALLDSGIKPFMVSEIEYPGMEEYWERGTKRVHSFLDFF